jgi:hypothetical protein
MVRKGRKFNKMENQGQAPTCHTVPPSVLCSSVVPQVEPAIGWSLPWAKCQ